MSKDEEIGINADFLDDKIEELQENRDVEVKGFTKETDKAYGFGVSVYEISSEQTVGRMIWIPKSQVKEKNGKIIFPNWLLNKRIQEIRDDLKVGSWSNVSDNVFEFEGLDKFEKQNLKLVENKGNNKLQKAYKTLGLVK